MIPESNEILTGKYSFKLVRNSNKINRLENNMRLHRVSNNRFVGFWLGKGHQIVIGTSFKTRILGDQLWHENTI